MAKTTTKTKTTKTTTMISTVFAVALAGCFAAGCDAAHEAAHDTAEAAHDLAAETHGDAEAIPASDPRVQKVLAAADSFDGAADKVVSNCGGCALHMEGSADHSLEVGDYEMHFCSAGCRDRFGEDATASLIAMAENMPEAK